MFPLNHVSDIPRPFPSHSFIYHPVRDDSGIEISHLSLCILRIHAVTHLTICLFLLNVSKVARFNTDSDLPSNPLPSPRMSSFCFLLCSPVTMTQPSHRHDNCLYLHGQAIYNLSKLTFLSCLCFCYWSTHGHSPIT